MRDRRYAYFLVFLMLIGLILRLYYALKGHHEALIYDQLEYTKLAIQYIEKGIFAYRDISPNSLVTPGYPWFLIIMYRLLGYQPLDHALLAIRITQSFISIGAIGFIYLLGRRLFNRPTGIIAAALLTFYPTYIWTTSLLTTETLFLSFFLALLYLQTRIIQENRPSDHIWMGILLALTVLIRPNVLPLAAIPYIFLWIENRKLYGSAILLSFGAFALVMLPWWIRNIATFHQFTLLANGGSGNPFLGGTDPYFRQTIDWSQMKEDDQFNEGLQRIKQGLSDDPWLWIRWFTVGKFMVLFKTPYFHTLPVLIANILVKLHLIFAWVAWLSLISCRNRSLRFLTLSLLALLVIHLLFVPDVRYSFGMYPFLMLGFAYAVTVLLQGFSIIPLQPYRDHKNQSL
ncbi:MAG: glycosyltransferase family 39 protein [Paenibacillaceae bacterium]